MQASDVLAAMSLQLQQAAQLQLAAFATQQPALHSAAALSSATSGPMTGVVRAWYEERGFGFIAPDNGSQDVFIHRKQLVEGQTLHQGARVQFELSTSNSSSGKPAASRVTVIGEDGGSMLSSSSTATVSVGGGGTSPSAGTSAAAAAAAALASASSRFAKGGPEPSDNLFICGLPLDTTEDKLKKIFGEYGNVTSMKLLPDVPGKPDKSALVRMADVSQASWMVEKLHGNTPNGLASPVTVRFADNRAQKARELGLPKPGTPGAYGPVGRATMSMVAAAAQQRAVGPYGALTAPTGDPLSAATAAGATAAAGLAGDLALGGGGNAALLLAALAQLQQAVPIAMAPPPSAAQSLQELLQDLQNLQSLASSSAAAAGAPGCFLTPS